MTIPATQPPQQMGPTPRSSRGRFRDRSSQALLALGVIAVVTSILTMLSFGLFIGAGAIALLLPGALLYPTQTRWKIAIGGTAWSAFCLVIVLTALISD